MKLLDRDLRRRLTLVVCAVMGLLLSVRIVDPFVIAPENVEQLIPVLQLDTFAEGNPPARFALRGDMGALIVASGHANELWTRDGEKRVMDTVRAGGFTPLVYFEGQRPMAVISGDRGSLRFYDMATGTLVRQFDTPRRDFDNAWQVSPDRRLLVATEGEQTLSVYEIDSGVRRFAVTAPDGYRVAWSNPTFSPDSTLLAVQFQRLRDGRDVVGYEIFLWDVQTGALVRYFEDSLYEGTPYDMAFSADGTLLAVGGSSPNIDSHIQRHAQFHVWDTTTGTRIVRWKGGGLAAQQLSFSLDGKQLAAYGYNDVWLWELDGRLEPGGAKLFLEADNRNDYTSMALSPDGRLLAVGAPAGHIWLYDTGTGERIAEIEGHPSRQTLSRVYGLAFSADGYLLVSIGGDHSARFWAVREPPYALPSAGMNTALPTPVMTPTVPGS